MGPGGGVPSLFSIKKILTAVFCTYHTCKYLFSQWKKLQSAGIADHSDRWDVKKKFAGFHATLQLCRALDGEAHYVCSSC